MQIFQKYANFPLKNKWSTFQSRNLSKIFFIIFCKLSENILWRNLRIFCKLPENFLFFVLKMIQLGNFSEDPGAIFLLSEALKSKISTTTREREREREKKTREREKEKILQVPEVSFKHFQSDWSNFGLKKSSQSSDLGLTHFSSSSSLPLTYSAKEGNVRKRKGEGKEE